MNSEKYFDNGKYSREWNKEDILSINNKLNNNQINNILNEIDNYLEGFIFNYDMLVLTVRKYQ